MTTSGEKCDRHEKHEAILLDVEKRVGSLENEHREAIRRIDAHKREAKETDIYLRDHITQSLTRVEKITKQEGQIETLIRSDEKKIEDIEAIKISLINMERNQIIGMNNLAAAQKESSNRTERWILIGVISGLLTVIGGFGAGIYFLIDVGGNKKQIEVNTEEIRNIKTIIKIGGEHAI